MPDAKTPAQGADESIQQFLDKYHALRESGKSVKDALDDLDIEFGEMLRAILPRETIGVINPDEYAKLVNVAKLLSLLGFEDDEIEMNINNRHFLGSVVLKSDDMVFNRECLEVLNEILDDVGSVNLRATSDGRVRMGFTIPHVLKPL